MIFIGSSHTVTFLAFQEVSPLVAASVGPYGACLHDGSEYTGNYVNTVPRETLKYFHRCRLRHIMAAKPDIVAIETIPALEEALILTELLGIPWCTSMGQLAVPWREAHSIRWRFRRRCVLPVGLFSSDCCWFELLCPADCWASVEECSRFVQRKPFVVYPNSGEVWSAEDGASVGVTVTKHRWKEMTGRRWFPSGCHVGRAGLAAAVEFDLAISEQFAHQSQSGWNMNKLNDEAYYNGQIVKLQTKFNFYGSL